MVFIPKKTANKEMAIYKSLYIKEKLVDAVESIAKKYNTSFNNVVISMIEILFRKRRFRFIMF